MDTAEEFSYEQSIRELDAMVQRFERAEIGVDELVGQVKRAGELIRGCRQRLRSVEDEMQAALKDLERGGIEVVHATAPPPVAPTVLPRLKPLQQSAEPDPFVAAQPAAPKIIEDPFADDDIPAAPTDGDDPFEADPPKRPDSKPKPSTNNDGGLFLF
jgi:exodeoxyribonuclease VII small subunit